MLTSEKLELTIKINEFPDAQTVENGWKQFDLDCDGKLVRVKVKPKVFKKLEQAQADYPMWVATASKAALEGMSQRKYLKEWAAQYGMTEK